MTIDWAHFTPWPSLAGGLLIGLSVAVFVLFSGRIAGISSIAGGLLRPVRGDLAWRVAFLAGLVLAPLVYSLFVPLPAIRVTATLPVLVAAGLLVGVGARYGSGCTSGHGVCGLSRLSPRSLVATAAFMTTGMITVFVARQFAAF